MFKSYFINQGLKEAQIEEFIRKKYPEGNYSHMELKRTPLGIKIIIYSSSPGRIIGKGGKTINEITNALKERFSLENPQLDVKSVAVPFLDAKIVAKQIALSMERGFNFKRVGNTTLKRIMSAGAIGAEIIISGRITGGKGMTAKFSDGHLKHSGEPSKTLVDYGFEELYQIGRSKPGKVGIKVKIMRQFQHITGEITTTLEKPRPPKEAEDVKEDSKSPKEEKPKNVKEDPKPTKEEKKTAKPQSSAKPAKKQKKGEKA